MAPPPPLRLRRDRMRGGWSRRCTCAWTPRPYGTPWWPTPRRRRATSTCSCACSRCRSLSRTASWQSSGGST
eukprot:6528079-Lingulodinium_polyedra.AAC.1